MVADFDAATLPGMQDHRSAQSDPVAAPSRQQPDVIANSDVACSPRLDADGTSGAKVSAQLATLQHAAHASAHRRNEHSEMDQHHIVSGICLIEEISHIGITGRSDSARSAGWRRGCEVLEKRKKSLRGRAASPRPQAPELRMKSPCVAGTSREKFTSLTFHARGAPGGSALPLDYLIDLALFKLIRKSCGLQVVNSP